MEANYQGQPDQPGLFCGQGHPGPQRAARQRGLSQATAQPGQDDEQAERAEKEAKKEAKRAAEVARRRGLQVIEDDPDYFDPEAVRQLVRTDAAAIWATGTFWWQIPRTVQVVLEGEMVLGLDGREAVARAGDCLLIPAGVAHWYANRGTQPVSFLCVVPLTDDYQTEWLEPLAEQG